MLFIDFPPVLQLQLKRFEYDFMRDTMVKVSILCGTLMLSVEQLIEAPVSAVYLLEQPAFFQFLLQESG